MSRHPAAGARATVSPLSGPVSPRSAAVGGGASFATVAALLTGPWRVNEPAAFATAMRTAPLVAGYPVVDLWRLTPPLSVSNETSFNDSVEQSMKFHYSLGHPPSPGLCASARHPTSGLDPLSAAAAGYLEAAVAGAADRAGLEVRWVAARQSSHLYVEAAARAAVGVDGPELLAIAHLVDHVSGGHLPADDSWVLVVVGDGQGGVAAVGRSDLPAARGGPSGGPRLGLGGLRSRLLGPARRAEGLRSPELATPEAVVLPFRR